jgi:flagellar basal-body rod modification protein FlgD
MSTISSTGATSNDLGSALGTSGTSALGKDEFLKLLTAQLQHQNPLSPMDNTAFVAQLAQFSSLEQMQNMNSSLATSIMVSQSVNNSLATSLIGRDIQARGDDVTHAVGGSEKLQFNLASGADVKVDVLDSTGKVVATVKSAGMASGNQSVTWDGNGLDGKPVAAGDYTFKVTATDSKGAAVTAETLVTGRVTGVKFEDGITYLMVGGRKISMGDVQQIVEAQTTKP